MVRMFRLGEEPRDDLTATATATELSPHCRRFHDGVAGVADVTGDLYGAKFKLLRDATMFASAHINDELEHGGMAQRCRSCAGVPSRLSRRYMKKLRVDW